MAAVAAAETTLRRRGITAAAQQKQNRWPAAKPRAKQQMKNDNEKLGRIPALKVDMLRHISDHGMAVEFNDTKLTALMGWMRHQDGRFLLKAGKSWLHIINRGRVTFTSFYSAAAGRTTEAVHYYDSATGLKSRVVDGDTLAAIGSSVLGGHLFGESRQETSFPCITSGFDQDAFRKWAKLSGWALLGESGLRARAVGDKLEEAGKRRGDAANAVKEAEARLAAAWLDTGEEFRGFAANREARIAALQGEPGRAAEHLGKIDAEMEAITDGEMTVEQANEFAALFLNALAGIKIS